LLEVDYDATDENIKLNYRRLALVGNLSFFIVAPTILSPQIFKLKIILHKFPYYVHMIQYIWQKWHPDKHGGDNAVTTKFQEINEAYNGKRYTFSFFL